MPSSTIYIAITGKQATGKTSLAAHLDGQVFFSHPHGSEFRFSVIDGKSESANVLIIVFDVSTPTSYPEELLDEAYIRKQSLCVVGTKSDLLIQEDSHSELTNREYSCRFGYYYDADYVLVSNVTGDGIEGLIQAIVCNLYPVPPLKRTFIERLSSGASFLVSSILDGIVAFFVLPHPRQQQDIPVVPLIESDDEVIHLMDSSAVKNWDKSLFQRLNAGGPSQGVPSHLITPLLIAKDATSSERDSMEYVRQHTSIPIPRVYHNHLLWLIMDRIDGQMLYECWNEQSAFMKFRIACTLRLYVKQLRSLTSERAGGITDGMIGGVVFDQVERGPFDSVRRFRRFCELVSFVGWKTAYERKRRKSHAMHSRPPSSDGDWTLVFTHGDLNATNIMLDKNNVLWLIDWGSSGFYPACVESLAMRCVDGNGEEEDRMPKSWARYRSFIAGRSSRSEDDFWHYLTSTIHRF